MAYHLWQEKTSPELQALVEAAGDKAIALLPCGALEQHGPHLPLETDNLIGVSLLNELRCRDHKTYELLLLPALPFGASREHESFKGTLSLDGSLFLELVCSVGKGVSRSGIKTLVLLSSHGGNNHLLTEAALRLRAEWGMRVVVTSWARLMAPIHELPDDEVSKGIHGGAIETGLLRFLSPHSIRDEEIKNFVSARPDIDVQPAWLAEDLHQEGVVGDARLGTRDLGEVLTRRATGALIKLLSQLAKA